MAIAEPLVWSYSGMKTFEQCPKKFYHTKILKDVKEPDTQATLYGKSMHTAAEEYIRDGTPLPPQFAQFQPLLDQFNAIPGTKLCEVTLGLTRDYQACGFDDANVWWHGIADLVIINKEKGLAHSVDYKTSKSDRYADLKQLDLVAAGIFARFPEVHTIKSALAFVVVGSLVTKKHFRKDFELYLKGPTEMVRRIEVARETNVWNPKSGPLCRFCSIRTCEYNES